MTRALYGMVVAGCSLAFVAPAGAAHGRIYGFSITGARLSEVTTFHGGPNCQRSGVCGYTGTVAYAFDHAQGASAVQIKGHHARGLGFFEMNGLTSATVQAPGADAPCSDKIIRRSDPFEVEGSASRISLVFHPPAAEPDFLNNYCAGPRDADVASALPRVVVPVRELLGKQILLLHTSAVRPFQAGPFEGTVAFSADIRLRRSHRPIQLFRIVPLE